MKKYNNLKDSKIQKHYLNIILKSYFWSSLIIGGLYCDKKGAHLLLLISYLINQITYYEKTYNKPYKLQSYREIARITGIPKSSAYDILKKLEDVLFSSDKQPYLTRDAIKNQTLTLKQEFKLAARYKNQIINLDKLDELYFKKYGKQLYAFRTKWYEELRIKTKENDKILWNMTFESEDKYKKQKLIIEFKQHLISESKGLILDLKNFMINIHNQALDYINRNYS